MTGSIRLLAPDYDAAAIGEMEDPRPRDIDELKGHNAGNRLLLESHLCELAALTAAERYGHSPTVREVVELADEYGVDVPLALRDAAIDSAE